MAYGFNDNTYKVLRPVQYREVFKKESIDLPSGELIGSAIANAIIVDEEDQEATFDLEGQSYIDKMVELKYVELVV